MRKPSPALIVALISLFVALGGAGMAATGGNFILGKANSATSMTSLSAPRGGKALQVLNRSTTAGATALGLSVASGHAPFVVNSAAGKVPNLNADKLDGKDSTSFLPKTGKAADADKLDGIDSTGFVKGRGTFLANRIVFSATNTHTLLTIPGLGSLQATCQFSNAYINWYNDSGIQVDAWYDINNSHFDAVLAVPGYYTVADRSANKNGGTLVLGAGSDPNPRRTAVLHAFEFQNGNGAPCHFQVQGTVWTSQ